MKSHLSRRTTVDGDHRQSSDESLPLIHCHRLGELSRLVQRVMSISWNGEVPGKFCCCSTVVRICNENPNGLNASAQSRKSIRRERNRIDEIGARVRCQRC